MIKIYIASDHAGVELKSKILTLLQSNPWAQKYLTSDLGPQNTESVDYPDYADNVCKKLHGFTVLENKENQAHYSREIGILICGSGQGMAMRANKYSHIRAALCWNKEVAELSRQHNDANVLCLGSRTTDHELSLEIVATFLNTAFAGGRHSQRVVKVCTPV